MSAKKKPLTKKEANRLYLLRKKAKAEAAKFEAALEPQPPAETVPVATVEVRLPIAQAQILTEEFGKQLVDDMIMKDHGIELPPPTNTNFESEDWEPYAPNPDNVPIAKGETPETAIQPGDWHSPKVEEAKAGDSLESPQEPLGGVAPLSRHSVPDDAVERLGHAIDAIEWLSKQTRNLPPKTREIIKLRIERLKELRDTLK